MIKSPIIAPSLLAADFLNLKSEIEMINRSQADWLHVDIMDGRYVPNISFGMMIVEQIQPIITKPMDVHLMIVEPEKYIEEFVAAGAAGITVHYETCPHLHSTIHQIKKLGVRAGVAVNPHTPVSMLEHIVDDLDLVLVMSVNPGFGGQKFIFEALYKVKETRKMISERNAKALIEVDGGIGLQNATKVMQAGADVLVAGSSVFKAENPEKMIAQLKAIGDLPVYDV